MNDFNLPEDCDQFLSEGRQLDFEPEMCEAGAVLLRSIEELKLERLPVETYPSSFCDEDPLRNEDGEYEQDGFYYVLAVSLSTGQRVREAILLWLPIEKAFGTYDESHHDLLVFPSTTWDQIVATPLLYLNMLWEVDYEERNSGLVRELKPWPTHPFRPGLTLPEVAENRKV